MQELTEVLLIKTKLPNMNVFINVFIIGWIAKQIIYFLFIDFD